MWGKVVTFKSTPGYYPTVIPLAFHVDGVTLSVYGSVSPPGYSFHGQGESFVSTNTGVITEIEFMQASSSDFSFSTGNVYSSGSSAIWKGSASKVVFTASTVTGMVIVTVEENSDAPSDSITMTCIYQNGRYLYGKPEGTDRSTLIYGNVNNSFNNGDIIRGGYQIDQYGNFMPVGTWKKIGETHWIEPEEIPVEEISADMIYQYVCFNPVDLIQQDDSYMTIDDGTGTLTLYNMFDVEIEPPIEPAVDEELNIGTVNRLIDRILSGTGRIHSERLYYVEGFVEVYRNQVELVPTYIQAHSLTPSDDLNNDGEVNLADVNELINLIIDYYSNDW